jgi:hypothetical protein
MIVYERETPFERARPASPEQTDARIAAVIGADQAQGQLATRGQVEIGGLVKEIATEAVDGILERHAVGSHAHAARRIEHVRQLAAPHQLFKIGSEALALVAEPGARARPLGVECAGVPAASIQAIDEVLDAVEQIEVVQRRYAGLAGEVAQLVAGNVLTSTWVIRHRLAGRARGSLLLLSSLLLSASIGGLARFAFAAAAVDLGAHGRGAIAQHTGHVLEFLGQPTRGEPFALLLVLERRSGRAMPLRRAHKPHPVLNLGAVGHSLHAQAAGGIVEGSRIRQPGAILPAHQTPSPCSARRADELAGVELVGNGRALLQLGAELVERIP